MVVEPLPLSSIIIIVSPGITPKPKPVSIWREWVIRVPGSSVDLVQHCLDLSLVIVYSGIRSTSVKGFHADFEPANKGRFRGCDRGITRIV